MDSRLDENQSELGVLVLPVALEVLADGDGLLDEVVEVLWDLRCQAYIAKKISLSATRSRVGSEREHQSRGAQADRPPSEEYEDCSV